MSDGSDMIIGCDDRIRLLSALLAATNWPETARKRAPHGTHAHARLTGKVVAPLRAHPAAQTLQRLLDRDAPLDALFTVLLRLPWPDLTAPVPGWLPPEWPAQLRDFYQRANLADFWEREAHAWRQSQTEAARALAGARLRPFLERFLGPVTGRLILMPNISYPADQAVGVRGERDLICLCPPRAAWGDSPPWPFDEDRTYIVSTAIRQYGRLLLMPLLKARVEQVRQAAQSPLPVSDDYRARFPDWTSQFANLLFAGMVAIYLEDFVSPADARAFTLMESRLYGVALLPGVVSVLRRYLTDREAGRYESILDCLTLFPKQLRVAQRIMSL